MPRYATPTYDPRRSAKMKKAVDYLAKQRDKNIKEAQDNANGCFSVIGAIALTCIAVIAFILC